MPLEVKIEFVGRDAIMELRASVLSGHGTRVATLSRDLAPTTRHWAAFVGNTAIGCVSVMQLRGWALRGMAVSSEYRRRGVGAQLLEVVYSEVDAPMWCNARIEAVPFYAHMGWVEVGPVFDLQDRGPHQRMTWTAFALHM
ncbi:MAG: GNAT family N-acetyltransferase [Proteobacteria bacterium]|jgi:GNAT superfamily N-acetyltransferase|nr:GNAT family N-acetyltransferase [Pseudomonadota bacterium]